MIELKELRGQYNKTWKANTCYPHMHPKMAGYLISSLVEVMAYYNTHTSMLLGTVFMAMNRQVTKCLMITGNFLLFYMCGECTYDAPVHYQNKTKINKKIIIIIKVLSKQLVLNDQQF